MNTDLVINTQRSERGPSEQELGMLREKYRKSSQDHVFTFYEELSTAEKTGLFAQLPGFDPDRINKLADTVLYPRERRNDATFEPLPESATSSVWESDMTKWFESGLGLVAENQVAVVLLAGGQGTRLGSSMPKGCYNISLPSQKSLFQMQAERIRKIQQLASQKYRKSKVIVPWYILISEAIRKPTEDFFRQHDYFGLQPENVRFFEQSAVLPCISEEGKILMESRSKVAVASTGNGGLYRALVKDGILEDMRQRGIRHVHAYCVDNCLVKVADPAFIGFAAGRDVQVATKVVRKRNAKESVGLVMQDSNGKPVVVEYSEIDEEAVEAKDPNDPTLLKFRAANIANHYYSFAFLESIPQWVERLPYHAARKKIPCININTGQAVHPEKPNGIKLEQFMFDCFPFIVMEKFACVEVKREEEFSPLKNARGTGENDPDTSRKDVLLQGARWVRQAGGEVKSNLGIEISPLISYGGEGLEFLKNKEINALIELAKDLA